MAVFRDIPSVDELVRAAADSGLPHAVLTGAAREVLSAMRRDIAAGVEPGAPAARLREATAQLMEPSLRHVINATGVILHTNLGRAPLPAFEIPSGYSNLEYDLGQGHRGRRDTHVRALIEQLTGAPGIVVNNNAAAVYLVLNELAAGYEVIVSRGELIEIGDGFRIPDIMARAGVVIREVGATNRTRIDDYRAALTDRTRLILRVHPSNFTVTGFTGAPTLPELSALAREHHIPLYEDLGSGNLTDLTPYGIHEPIVKSSLDAGVHLVSFSGDKLLGGPQSGIIAGDGTLVERLRRNPMFRALRCDKLVYAALETTLRHILLGHLHEVPALRMIATPIHEIRNRAEAMNAQIPQLEIIAGESLVGGGSTPNQSILTWLLRLPEGNAHQQEQALRRYTPPVIARIAEGRVALDLRTVFSAEEPALVAAVVNAL